MAFSSGSTLQQTDEVAAVAPSSSGGGGGGGVSDWDDLTGEVSGPVPFDATDDDGNPTSRSLRFLNVTPQVDVTSDPANGIALEIKDQTNGTRLGTLTTDGRWETRGDMEAFADGSFGSGSSTNSLLQVEDAGTVLTTDAASLNFTGSELSLSQNGDEITVDVSGGSGSDIDIEDNQSVVVGGATGLSFEGSGIDSVDNDGDGTATVNISKGSSTEIQEGGTAQVSDATVLDFVGGDFSVANPTSGEAELSLQDDTVTVAGNSVSLGNSTAINHGDLSSIGSSDHHTRPSAGDGLSDSSNTFSVNESQVDHDSLNQYVANEHVDHSAVTISAGTALSGGGDLTASRTLDVTGPFTGIPFKTSGDNLEWQADANNDLILQNTTDSQTLLKVDQDTGTVFAAGDVVAFGLSGGGGSGSTSGLQADAPLTLDTTTDPDTIGLSVGSGLTVTNGTLEADGSVGVSSVFGRTGDVTASSGDYSASQISGFDEKAQDAVGTIMTGSGAATVTYDDAANTIAISATDTDTQLSDSEVQTAINNDSDHGSTASHNYTTSASRLSDVSPDSDPDAHHAVFEPADYTPGNDVSKSDVGLGNVPNVNPRSEMRNLGLRNEEMDASWVGGQPGGEVGYDASVGLFLDYGSAGSGVSKDVYPVLDAGNTKTGGNVNVTYNGIDTRPKISLSQGSGSGLDADTLDGVEGSSYARTDQRDTYGSGVELGGSPQITTTGNQDEFLEFGTDSTLSGDKTFTVQVDDDGSRANSSIRFRVGGSEFVRMTNDGHTGFGGEAAPSYAVDVNGTGNFSGDLYAAGNVGIGTTSPDRTLDVHGNGAEIRNDSNNENALRVIQRKNDPDAPASILVATDDDGEDVAFEVRGRGDGSAVDLTENTQTSSDMSVQIWSSGKINTDGPVGIGTTSPSYALEVSGDARATGEVEAFLGSDRRLKKHLDPLDSALDKVDQLMGYGFDWRGVGAVQPHKRDRADVGLIAQEVEEVLPEAVKTFSGGHSEGYKSVNYDKLVALLVEAIKDLRTQVNQLQ